MTLAFVCVHLDRGKKFVTIWVVTRGGGGSRQTVTNGDMGGRGVENRDFAVTYFLNGPLFEWYHPLYSELHSNITCPNQQVAS